MDVLTDLFITRGIPHHIRSDNGSEFTAKSIQAWLPKLGVKTLYITPGSPWENGYNESFNGRFRDEFLSCEVFYTLKEAASAYAPASSFMPPSMENYQLDQDS